MSVYGIFRHLLVRRIIPQILLFLFAITLIGCALIAPHTPLDAGNLHRVVYIENTFTPTEENYILNGVKEWECATGGMIRVRFVLHFSISDYTSISDPRHAIIFVKSNSNVEIIKQSDRDRQKDPNVIRFTVGLYEKGSGAITDQIFLVENMLSNQTYKGVVEHEFGHALGLAHNSNANSIMFPHIDGAAHNLTTNDLNEFCSLYNCKDAFIHPCE